MELLDLLINSYISIVGNNKNMKKVVYLLWIYIHESLQPCVKTLMKVNKTTKTKLWKGVLLYSTTQGMWTLKRPLEKRSPGDYMSQILTVLDSIKHDYMSQSLMKQKVVGRSPTVNERYPKRRGEESFSGLAMRNKEVGTS